MAGKQPHSSARQSTNFLDFADLIRHFPIHECLWSILPLKDAISLSQTCHQLRADYLRTFNITKRLLHFVRDPNALRSQLGKHNALISGSFALQLLAHTTWPDSDLDIFVETGTGATELDAYLQEEENYDLKSTKDADTYAMFELVEIRTYRRSSASNATQAHIQLIVTKHMPMIGILTGFYMTAVLNVISWNKAYAVFAKDTFIDRKTYMLQPLDAYFEGLLHKYNRRGWELNETIHRNDYDQTMSVQQLRRLGDTRTWVLPLPTDNVHRPTQPDFVLENTTFTMEWNGDQEWRHPGYPSSASYQISTTAFQHVALRHRFAVTQKAPWIQHLADRLSQHAKLQIMAIKPQDRPEWFRRGQDNIRLMFVRLLYEEGGNAISNFKQPEHWKYVDEKVPIWYRDWVAGYTPRDDLFPPQRD